MKILKIQQEDEDCITVWTDADLNKGYCFKLADVTGEGDLGKELKKRIAKDKEKKDKKAADKIIVDDLKNLIGVEI